jgi:O-antigen/teichoic acid export membrane protein
MRAGHAVQAIFQLMIGLVLARLLGPATYGLMAIAWIVLGPAMIIADAGLGLALVQRQLLTSEAIRYCFCPQSMIGLVVAGILCAIAPFWAAFLAMPELENVLLALSSIVLVQAFGLTAVNLLRRCLDFRRLQLLQVAALLSSTLLVSLPLALAGMGVWSLVAGALMNVAIVAVYASALVRAEPGMRTGLISFLAAAAAAVPALLAIESVGRWTVVVAAVVNTLLVSIGVRHATRGSSLRELRRAAAFGTSSMLFLLLNVVNAVTGAMPALLIGRLFGVAAVRPDRAPGANRRSIEAAACWPLLPPRLRMTKER